MAIPDRESIRRKLDSLGVAEVKRRLEVGAYAANKVPVVMAWLEEQLPAIEAAPEKSKTLADQYIERLKNHPVIAVIVVASAILVGVAQLTDSVAKIASSFPSIFRPAVALPVIPGDSGWLLLGDLDLNGERYIRGPFYSLEKSGYPDKSLTPRKGELVRLLSERNVVIAGYKTTGLANQFVAPWTLNVLSDVDYTGVKLQKEAVVEVRDVSLGSYPNQPIVVWVRIAAPPK